MNRQIFFGGWLAFAALAVANGAPLTFEPTGGEQGERRDQFFAQYSRKPFPKDGPWFPQGQAQLFYWTGEPEKGDAVVASWPPAPNDEQGGTASDEFHWQAAQWARLAVLFGHDGIYRPDTMSPAAEAEVKERLWQWLEPRVSMELVDPENDWLLWASENHHLQAWTSLWGALRLLALDPEYRDRNPGDDRSVAELKVAFDSYFKRWIHQRATRGMFVERNSPYAKYSLETFYQLFDLSDDPELKRLAGAFLDLYWTQWALEQVDGVRGGSRHRSYAGNTSIESSAAQDQAWYHFPLDGPIQMHPAAWSAITSSYAIPKITEEIFTRRDEIGPVQLVSRQPGLRDPAAPPAPNFVADRNNPIFEPKGVNALDPACGSLLRKTYSTPEFVLGGTMLRALPKSAWTNISSQNRWDGVTFAGAGTPSVFVQAGKLARGTGSHYNAQWTVGDQGVLIVQRLAGSDAVDQRVFFSKGIDHVERDGWIFAEAPDAYLALKVVDGEWEWEEDSAKSWRETKKFESGLGEWLVPEKWMTPLVIEVAPKRDYADFASFQDEILANPLKFSDARLDYRSSHYQTELTLLADYSEVPRINGQPVDFDTSAGWDGGVLGGAVGGDTVTLRILGQKHLFDFSTSNPPKQ